MVLYDVYQAFLHFRNNGEAHGELIVEVLVEQLAPALLRWHGSGDQARR
ncbi:MAG: hypothetical protein ACRYFU_22365 [Janthinobacterium lividum]